MVFVFGGAYAGKEEYAKKEYGEDVKIIRDIHMLVRNIMHEGKNPLAELERLVFENPDVVFISNEVGYGIVPEDRFEREWREEVGRANCYLADKADKAVRVVCGIGVVVK